MENTNQITSSTEKTFFALLRACLWGEQRFPFSPKPDTDWTAIRTELNHHAIDNLPVDLLAKYHCAKENVYMAMAIKGLTHWYKLMKTQHEICRILQSHQIPCAVIKGAAADMYYPQPPNRNMGDIDLLVAPGKLDTAVNVLLETGCTLHDDRNPRHIELRWDGFAVELHRHFAALSDTGRAKRVDDCLFNALNRAETAVIEGYSFPHLPKKENGLALLEHINLHMESGLGFRQIIDWMMFADAVLSDEFWHDEFEGMTRKAGLKTLAITVTRMCQLYLGLTEDITWCRSADLNLCRDLLIHIMQQGNFGKKIASQEKGTAYVLGILDSDLNFFQLLQKHGCYNWKALRRHPWLKPFAWLYQLCRYIRRGLSNAHWLRGLRSAFRRKKKNTDLLDQIGVQRTNHALQHHKD